MIKYTYCALLLGSMAAFAGGCDTEDATKAVVTNAYPVIAAGGDRTKQTVVYKAWWVTTLFTDPVLPGASSDEERSVPETDFVYALLAPGWDPASGAAPDTLITVKSKTKLGVERGATLSIVLSDSTFSGNCAANQPLAQDDADFITQRIFPGSFANTVYDAKTCKATLLGSDAGTD